MVYRFVFLALLLTPDLSATEARLLKDPGLQATITQVVEQTFLLNYDQALCWADTLSAEEPQHPIGPLMQAGVLYCRMLDLEDALDMEAFTGYYDEAWSRAECLRKTEAKAEANLCFGILLGFKALLHQRQGQWWGAVKVGMKSVGYLKSCWEQDSTYVDALLGIGTYKYWRSRATEFINWLPFVPDEKKAGIARVRRAMEEGILGKEIARSTLAWLLIDYGHPSEAIELSQEGLNNYPGSRFFLWTLADGYINTGQWRRALEAYQQIFTSLQPLPRNNHFNEVGLCKQIARCYQHLKKPKSALEWVEKGLSLPLDPVVAKRRSREVDRLKTMKIELEKQLSAAQAKPTAEK